MDIEFQRCSQKALAPLATLFGPLSRRGDLAFSLARGESWLTRQTGRVAIFAISAPFDWTLLHLCPSVRAEQIL
jgi:hypothetical protein